MFSSGLLVGLRCLILVFSVFRRSLIFFLFFFIGHCIICLFRLTAFDYHILIFKLFCKHSYWFLANKSLFAAGLLLASEKFDANICVS